MLKLRRTQYAPLFVVLVVALSIGALAPGAGAGPGPIDCPDRKPVSELTAGMTGTGWTVSVGEEPEPFDVEVLGILEDGVAPGRDLIVIEASSPAITQAGGVWQGMSGSPVYVDGELIGAVAYSLGFGPSDVVGLTTARDLFRLAGYPVAVAPTRRSAYSRPSEVRTSSGRMVGDADEYKRMQLPMQISGVTERAVRRLERTLKREKAPYRVYAGSSAAGALGPAATLSAGDSFAAALSYGDVTFATIGTTSLVCEEKAIAFGHPVSWSGDTEMGANAATTVGVVEDSVAGPYKLAKVQGLAGTVDQDRLAGVRALLTDIPEVTPVVSEVTAANTGLTQEGTSYGVFDRVMPSLAFYHFLGHMDSTFDQISAGSSTVTFKIKGMTDEGTEFIHTRTNEFSTHEDIAITSSLELERTMWTLFTQPFENVHFTKVKIEAALSEQRSDLRLRRVRVSKNGGPFRGVREMKVDKGDKLTVRARLMNPDKVIEKVDMQLTVPRDASGQGALQVAGSSSEAFQDQGLSCFFVGEICRADLPRSVDSFEEVLEFLAGRDKNTVLRAELRVGRRVGDVAKTNLGGPVTGSDYVSIDYPGGRDFVEPHSGE